MIALADTFEVNIDPGFFLVSKRLDRSNPDDIEEMNSNALKNLGDDTLGLDSRKRIKILILFGVIEVNCATAKPISVNSLCHFYQTSVGSGRSPDYGVVSVHHVGVLCDNLERSLEFYQGILGIPYTLSRSGRPAIFTRDPDANALEFTQVDG
ncbi:hypothetical protein NC653_038872 [Populus alba x Populus x berolinensis]|uniref:VOC domain-containing protein n=1 Tax=Populus alba x Populus x berolinensis TaxID=444605 RepID=A0AAD6L9W1_9ROSI|nr:hypothetical protein NC653_038872 [Populus alba x Populus x berolinensis]